VLAPNLCLVEPHGVWGLVLEAGGGAIQTDIVADLVRYLAQHELRKSAAGGL
jgi:hypothetical protein